MSHALLQKDDGSEVLEQIGSAVFGDDVSLNGIITPTTLAGDVNNYAPTGLATCSVIRLGGGSSDRNISGIAAPPAGKSQVILLLNIGTSNALILNNQSGSSSTGNKFFGEGAGDVTVHKGGGVWLYYDTVSAAWRIVTP